ncbi:MAG: STELLO glycosyltransferase family protein [Terracidiphilus sp.]|nr:STELLO glycosyltransferase family protein [Terracidiphilus sp.]
MKNHLFDGPAAVVVTSISAPNSVLREIASQCKTRGLSFYLIGDVPSPKDFSLEGCDFYSLERQKSTGLKTEELLPKRHYARKNIGYLLAMQNRSSMMLETDDDNMPLDGFWGARELKKRVRHLAGCGWANIYAYFSEANIWPRGLPLDAIQAPPPKFESLPELEADCPIQQGLADGNPDVDAIYRMVLPLPINFLPDRQVALGDGAWSPFNSQNTVWFPQAYPLLYLPSYCSFRMTDIWRSFVAQRIAWENGWSILYSSPDVVQERNEHSLIKDFTDEVPGYLNNRTIGEKLAGLKLAAGVENIGENLVRCYEELVRISVVGAEEIPLVKAWAEDIADFS